MGKTRKVLLLAGLVGIGSVVLKNLRQEGAPAPVAPRPAPPAAAAPTPEPTPEPAPEPVPEPVPDASAGPQVVAEDDAAPVLQAPVAEEHVSDTPIGDSAESLVDTSTFAPVTDASPETPADGTVAEPAEETGPPADSLTSFFDEVLTESQETKRGRRR